MDHCSVDFTEESLHCFQQPLLLHHCIHLIIVIVHQFLSAELVDLFHFLGTWVDQTQFYFLGNAGFDKCRGAFDLPNNVRHSLVTIGQFRLQHVQLDTANVFLVKIFC